MRIKVNLKQLGKRRNAVKQEEYQISDHLKNIQDLIIDLVTREVAKYNQKIENSEKEGKAEVLSYLTTEQVNDQSNAGKISFGEIYNLKKQDLTKAIENAIQSFEDGIYCIFINEQQYEKLNQEINLKEEDQLTFVRLTMLAGRMW